MTFRIVIQQISIRLVWLLPFAALTGCGVYGTFRSPQYEITDDAFGSVDHTDSLSMGDLRWQEFFRDSHLAALIDSALCNNADLQTTRLKVEEAQVQLRSSRLAYLPSVDFSASANHNDGSWNVQLPVNASWEIDFFGSLRNVKRGRLAALLASEAYAQAVQSQLVATVASTYYTLLALDAQRDVYVETEQSWNRNVEVTRRLMEAGRYNAASLAQTEANYCSICNNLVEIDRQIRQTENQICRLLGWTPRAIARGKLAEWSAPERLSVGIPLRILSRRPDVRQAEQELAEAFYATNQARSDFYPSVTLSGSYDLRHTLSEIVGSFLQPIFQRGTLRANLRVAKAQEQQAEIAFKQAVVDAGIEVNDALIDIKSARTKAGNYARQVEQLQKAVESTQLLMLHGSTTYLEVLTAQQTLLEAQIGAITNRLSEISGVITLYQALGGGGY